MGKQKGMNHNDFMRLSDMNDDGVTMRHADPTVTLPPVTVEGKEESSYVVNEGSRPVLDQKGELTGKQVGVYKNVYSSGVEGEPYQLDESLPPASEWDKPENKALIDREMAKTNALTNEPAMLKQAARDQITSGNTSAAPQNTDALAKSAFMTADPQPLIPEEKPAEYANPKGKARK